MKEKQKTKQKMSSANTTVSPTAAEVAFLAKLSADINNYFLYASSAIGIPLNIVSTIIFIRLSNTKTNMGFLYACQTITDFLVLSLQLLVFRSSVVFGRNFTAFSMGACKFITFMRRFVIHVSAMIPVLITFDRFIFILYGHVHRYRKLQKRRYLALMLLAMFAVITLFDIPNFFYYIGSRGTCSNDTITDIFADVISIVFKTFVPFIFMGILNWFIVRRLIRRDSVNTGLVLRPGQKKKSIFSRKDSP